MWFAKENINKKTNLLNFDGGSGGRSTGFVFRLQLVFYRVINGFAFMPCRIGHQSSFDGRNDRNARHSAPALVINTRAGISLDGWFILRGELYGGPQWTGIRNCCQSFAKLIVSSDRIVGFANPHWCPFARRPSRISRSVCLLTLFIVTYNRFRSIILYCHSIMDLFSNIDIRFPITFRVQIRVDTTNYGKWNEMELSSQMRRFGCAPALFSITFILKWVDGVCVCVCVLFSSASLFASLPLRSVQIETMPTKVCE